MTPGALVFQLTAEIRKNILRKYLRLKVTNGKGECRKPVFATQNMKIGLELVHLTVSERNAINANSTKNQSDMTSGT